MRSLLLTFLLLIAAGCMSAQNEGNDNAFPLFALHHIDNIGFNIGQTALVDMDNDGDLDVFSCGGPLSANGRHDNIIWENDSGAWTTHVVADQPCHETQGGDVDGDGDIDIVAKPWSNGDKHYFLRNLAMESP